jgi:flagellar hook-length control protein FliK
VPQVATEATTPAYKPAPLTPAWAAPNSDGAPDLPFESLLDDNTQASAAPPPQAPPAPDEKTANAAQPDSAQPSANANDGNALHTSGNINAANVTHGGKAAQISSNVNAAGATNTAATDTTAANGKPTANGKVKADAKPGEQTKAAATSKPAGDSKSDGIPAVVTLPADPTSTPVQHVAPAVVVATAPTPGMVIPPPTGRASQAAPATTQTKIVKADAPKPKASGLAAAQDGTDKPAADDVSTATPRAPAQTTAPVVTDAQATAPKSNDAMQQASLTAPSPDVSPAPANPTAPAAPAAQPGLAAPAAAVPIAGVAIEIASMAQAGKNHFEIRLDPPELGRIEVRLDVDRDGHATTRLIADRSDTLDLLRRDATGLERALQDAGLKTTDNGLQFSLRDQTMNNEQSATPAPSSAQLIIQDNTLSINDMTQRNYSRLAGLRGGIDIRV